MVSTDRTRGEKRREKEEGRGRRKGGEEEVTNREKVGVTHLQELLEVVRCVSPKI
jgi:hypothetical protein